MIEKIDAKILPSEIFKQIIILYDFFSKINKKYSFYNMFLMAKDNPDFMKKLEMNYKRFMYFLKLFEEMKNVFAISIETRSAPDCQEFYNKLIADEPSIIFFVFKQQKFFNENRIALISLLSQYQRIVRWQYFIEDVSYRFEEEE